MRVEAKATGISRATLQRKAGPGKSLLEAGRMLEVGGLRLEVEECWRSEVGGWMSEAWGREGVASDLTPWTSDVLPFASDLKPLPSSAVPSEPDQLNRERKDDRSPLGPILDNTHISRISRLKLAINSTQPSNRW
jgi:hypothetical protein